MFLLIAACVGKHSTHRPTFLLGYQNRRCFKENFYHGSTFELYAELVEPETLLNELIKKEDTDGIHYHVVYTRTNQIITKGILGNKEKNSYVGFNYLIDDVHKEGVYVVCFQPSNTLFHNAAEMTEKTEGGTSMFGKIFQHQDFSKLNFELSVTLERVFHGTFQTQQELEKAHGSVSKREKMAASNIITHESLN